jgi:predicted Ser/Thr protein kinase
MFLDDEYLLSAIFLEYITGLEMISLHNYTQQRMDNILEGIRQIHKALVRHRDPKPRNIMVVTDTPERVIWIDFDRAETYDEDRITNEQKELLEEEEEIVAGFKSCLVSAPAAKVVQRDHFYQISSPVI